MFNYFRSHAQPLPHRRTGSTPASPQSSSWEYPSRQPQTEATSFPGASSMSGYGTPLTESPISPIPPQLPPIPRVASRNGHHTPPNAGPQLRHVTTKLPARDDHGVSSAQGFIPQARDGLPSIRRVSAERAHPNEPETQSDHRLFTPGTTYALPDHSREQSNRPTSSRSAISTTDNLATRQNSFFSVSPNASSTTLVNTISSINLPMEAQRFSSRGLPPSKESSQKTKAKFNLLNPMNLLSRRRTSQGGESLQEAAFSSHRASAVPAMRLPDDYDPRIKGAGVHDFNAPRPRRNPSMSDAETAPLNSSIPEKLFVSVPKTTLDPQRQPVFVEQFESQRPAQGNAEIRRENLANMDFVKRMSKHLDEPEISAHDLTMRTPSPSDFAVPAAARTPPTAERVSKETVSTAYRGSIDRSTVNSSTSLDTGNTSPALSPSGSRSMRTSPAPDLGFRSSLPRHMVSNASRTSRFSFQQNESSLAQEKALEEKHKRKIGNDETRNEDYDSRFDDLDEEDPSAYDDYDFDDGDDDIPYIGDDASDFAANRRISTPLRAAVQEQESAPPLTTRSEQQTPTAPQGFETSNTPVKDGDIVKETMDDLYFDDGISEDDKVDLPVDVAHFDESTLDSMVHHSQYDMPRDRRLPADGREAHVADQRLQVHLDSSGSVNSVSSSTIPEVNLDQIPSRIPSDAGNTLQKVSDSTRLHAYHSALASAANRAAEVGRFSRQPSLGTSSSFYGTSTAQSELSPADSVSAQRNIYEYLDEQPVNFDDYDTDLEEDPMIAAANAEVLATEDADFYGQEFGFYGGSSGAGEMFNGGYFGSSMTATGNAIKEPNLTPITERSEFSTRNSFISIQGHGSSSALSGLPGMPWNEAAPSPGLKDLMSQDDDDMTLGQLLKLRRETFGGIGPRGNASNVSQEGSPTHSVGSPTYPKSTLVQASSSPQGESILASAFDPEMTPRRPETTRSHSNVSGSVYSQEDTHQQLVPSNNVMPRIAQLSPRAGADTVEASSARSTPFFHAANPPMAPPQPPAGFQPLPPTLASTSSPTSSSASYVRVAPNIIRKPIQPMSDIPVLSPPQPQNRRASSTTQSSRMSDQPPVSPLLEQGEIGLSVDSSTSVSPIHSPEMKNVMHFAAPPAATSSLQSFAARAGPSSLKYHHHHQRSSPQHMTTDGSTPRPNTALPVSPPSNPIGPFAAANSSAHARASSLGDTRESVAYVLERGDLSRAEDQKTAQDRWYLERRRMTSSGEVVVVGRELIQGGRI